VWHLPPTPFRADIKERLELYLYSPSGLSWHILGEFYIYLYLSILRCQFPSACIEYQEEFSHPFDPSATLNLASSFGHYKHE